MKWKITIKRLQIEGDSRFFNFRAERDLDIEGEKIKVVVIGSFEGKRVLWEPELIVKTEEISEKAMKTIYNMRKELIKEVIEQIS